MASSVSSVGITLSSHAARRRRLCTRRQRSDSLWAQDWTAADFDVRQARAAFFTRPTDRPTNGPTNGRSQLNYFGVRWQTRFAARSLRQLVVVVAAKMCSRRTAQIGSSLARRRPSVGRSTQRSTTIVRDYRTLQRPIHRPPLSSAGSRQIPRTRAAQS